MRFIKTCPDNVTSFPKTSFENAREMDSNFTRFLKSGQAHSQTFFVCRGRGGGCSNFWDLYDYTWIILRSRWRVGVVR